MIYDKAKTSFLFKCPRYFSTKNILRPKIVSPINYQVSTVKSFDNKGLIVVPYILKNISPL